MARLLQIGVVFVVVAGLIAVLDFAMNPSGSPVRTTLKTVRDAAVEQYQRLSGQPVAPAEPSLPGPASGATPVAGRAAARSAAAEPAVVTPVPANPPLATPALPSPASTAAPTGSGPTSSATSGTRRGDFYLPGRMAAWTTYNVTVSGPLVIRAGGRLVAGNDATGPNGITTSNFERALDSRRSDAGSNQRVVSTAPYLALIGRVCSGDVCSEPFLVGSNTVICPADLKVSGNLQLWTNNYVRVDGMQTSLNYSSVFGGYSFYVEPAPESLCAAGTERAAGAASSLDVKDLEAGRTLRNPEFTISSSQSSWKPFFVPLSVPLIVRATGSMQPRGGADPTGPNGIVVPRVPQWSYPGARDVTVDADHRLYDPAFPYQALIGRLCSSSGCSNPFLVGSERVICPMPPNTDHLELWINHIISPAGLLGSQTPLTLDAFDLQTRRGSYRFEVSRAPAGACVP